MPISLPVYSASFALNRQYRENKLWSAHGLSAFAGPDSPVCTSFALRANCISFFKSLPLLMLCIVIINLLNKGTICLTQKMELCFSILWWRWISHVCNREETAGGEISASCLFSRCHSSSLVFHSFSVTPLWAATWAHLCTAMLGNVGTDKPAVMKMNVPTWSPIQFHYNLYLSGAGCQALGPVFLSPGLLWWNVTANRGRAGLPRTNLCLESCNSFDFGFSVSLLLYSLPYQIKKSIFVYSVLIPDVCMSSFLILVRRLRFGKRNQMWAWATKLNLGNKNLADNQTGKVVWGNKTSKKQLRTNR